MLRAQEHFLTPSELGDRAFESRRRADFQEKSSWIVRGHDISSEVDWLLVLNFHDFGDFWEIR